MTKFQDGPAAGQLLELRRAPTFLRVVRDPTYASAACKRGRSEWDALDQLDDAPRPGEVLLAYRKVGDEGSMHLLGTRNGRRFGRWIVRATYRLCEAQPDDSVMRDTGRWRAWCQEQMKGATVNAEAR